MCRKVTRLLCVGSRCMSAYILEPSIKVFFAYREVLLTSLYDKKPDGQDRTAAEKNYAAKAACRRRRILQSKILCNCSVDLRTCCADRKIT